MAVLRVKTEDSKPPQGAWDAIASLAKRLLGVSTATSSDLAKINRSIAPTPRGKPDDTTVVANKNTPGQIPYQDEPIDILPEFAFVLESIKCGYPGVFVTGRAGTGKSTLVRFLTKNIKNCAVVAPTALAAINVGGTTIHSFFSIPTRTLNPDEAGDPKQLIMPVIEALDALVIDEISMVHPDLIDCISNTLKKVRRDTRPFGGVPVVFVGDLLQLPPVVSDEEVARYYTERYSTPFFFSADIFKEFQLVSIELIRVFRQTNEEFVGMLDKIRSNNDHRDAIARINRDCFREQISTTALHLVPTNAAAKSINTRNLDRLQAPLHSFTAIVDGEFHSQKDRFPAPYILELKEGARVLFVRNNKPFWINGTLGEIVAIEESILRIKILPAGNVVSVSRARWDKIRYRFDKKDQRITSESAGSFSQFPVTLGWAITIHKSQGMTLDSVRIDMGRGAFCSGQTYVALSRCRSMEGITLDKPISMNDVRADETILEFYRRLSPMQYKVPNGDEKPSSE